MPEKVSFLVFFLMWAKRQGWKVPPLHVRMCEWLDQERDHPIRVLRVFRGAAKSTLLAVYNAWRYYLDPTHRIMHQGDQDNTAYKTARDTKAVLTRHPLTRRIAKVRGEVSFWWVPGADDERNPSMQAAGILSTTTSSRADEIQNDDVEVPKNIQTPDGRAKLRYRLSEQTFILVPGGSVLFVGTPHTHDSIYDEEIKGGACHLTIPLFAESVRYQDGLQQVFPIPFREHDDGLWVFQGIGSSSRLLVEGIDYQVSRGSVVFDRPPGTTIDIYSGNAWPERFDRKDVAIRRRKCKTWNEWDSQYQLKARPVHDVRLDPDRLVAYDVEPTIIKANGSVSMWLGKVKLIGCVAYWDVATGKPKGDDSVLSLVFTDEAGRYYWHRAAELSGDVWDEDKARLPFTQCGQVRALVEAFQLPAVHVETNGAGAFVPKMLISTLKGTGCAVREVTRKQRKDAYILDALEAPLSSRIIWCHVSVLDTKAPEQMRDWIPGIDDQPDDYIDALAGAVTETPVRIGKQVTPQGTEVDRWSAQTGTFEVEVDFAGA